MRATFLAENVALLRQGIALLEGLDGSRYGRRDPRVGAAVGSHVRHVLDFYVCFLRDLATGRIDYDDRPRDARLETDLDHALRVMGELAKRLAGVDPEGGPEELEVKTDLTDGTERPLAAPSSVERELQFLASHTIHHYSLIAVQLRLADHPVPDHFGVAPSTLRYWKETRPRAG